MTETRFPNGIKGGKGTDLELKSDTNIALYPADHVWIGQGTKLIFEGISPNNSQIRLQATSVTANRDIILPDSAGTLATQEWVNTTATYQNSNVDLHLNTSTASASEVLSWNGTDYAWVANSGSGTAYDQSLNTTDDVTFNSITTDTLDITGAGISRIESGSNLELVAANRVLVTDTPFRVAQLTTATRDGFIPQNGDIIYNTTTSKMEVYQESSWINLVGSGSYTNSDVDSHLNTSSATSGQVLGWNGSDYAWSSPAGSLQSRTTAAHTTASLSDGATENFSLTMAKSFSLMSIETSAASWVRLYVNEASRTSDASRTQEQDPGSNSGVIAEVITTGAQTIILSPAVMGFNLENPVTSVIPCAITNLIGTTQTIDINVLYLNLES